MSLAEGLGGRTLAVVAAWIGYIGVCILGHLALEALMEVDVKAMCAVRQMAA